MELVKRAGHVRRQVLKCFVKHDSCDWEQGRLTSMGMGTGKADKYGNGNREAHKYGNGNREG